MYIFKTKKELQEFINQNKNEGKLVGFAPTMGALHDGHMALYSEANRKCNVVLSSIFVNPTQFNTPEDFALYPNTLEVDIQKLKQSKCVDVLYLPQVNELYPNGLKSKKYPLGDLETTMEGKFRAGHFQGVATVVEALLKHVLPDIAFFGEKDFQQLAVVRHLVDYLQLPIEIVGVPTIREESGLAMSSRNLRLSEVGKKQAANLYQLLLKVKTWSMHFDIKKIHEEVERWFSQHEEFSLEYFEIAKEGSLQTIYSGKLDTEKEKYRAFLVAYLEGIRLIDNIPLY